MGRHRHEFVNTFDEGQIAFGLSRELDEKSLIAYLQKFTDDELMHLLVKRLTDAEIEDIVNFVTKILRKHLAEEEYHKYFLKDERHH
ncbi:MAG TPA: cytoplasmic protein [Proteobacteria bacterium]|nr:cytoplasmic protein [Pseudomonadota bacterium]